MTTIRCAGCGLTAQADLSRVPIVLPDRWIYLVGIKVYVCSETCATTQRNKPLPR